MRRRRRRSRLASLKRNAVTNTKEEHTMVKPTLRYIRYVLASLASVGFGLSIN
jgi:hypothetical protein